LRTDLAVNSVQEAGGKYIKAVNAYIEKKIDQVELSNVEDEFKDVLKDISRLDMIHALTKSMQNIQKELNDLLSLADRIDDYNLQRAIINLEKALEEIGEISELKYVTKDD
jgi:protein subunit release factor A